MATSWHLLQAPADIAPVVGSHKFLSTVNGAGSGNSNTSSVNGPVGTPGIQAQAVGPLPLYWWTPQLVGVTISANITFSFRVRESNASANAGLVVSLYRTDYAGRIISTIIQSTNGLEMPVSALFPATVWVGTPSATTLQDGDRLLCIVSYTDADSLGDSMKSGFLLSVHFDGAAGLAFDSFFTLAEAVTTLSPTVGTPHTLPSQGVGN